MLPGLKLNMIDGRSGRPPSVSLARLPSQSSGRHTIESEPPTAYRFARSLCRIGVIAPAWLVETLTGFQK